MISASLPGEALAQLGQLGQLSHLYPPPPQAGMTPEFLAPPPRPYARYAPRRPRDSMPAPPQPHVPSTASAVPSPLTPAFPPVPGAYPYLHHPSYSYLYRARPQPPATYPLRPRPTSGFVPPAPAPHSPPVSTPAPAPPPPREEPPTSPERGAPAPYFCRGALIRLEDGSLRRVEEMRTEDFVMSADRSGELTLTQCTLLRLEERGDKIALTLTYDRNRSQVELESTVEHPFFVYGRGWASVKPERTMARYGLRVQRLQVGDVCVSLVAKKHAAGAVPATIPTTLSTATTHSFSASHGVPTSHGPPTPHGPLTPHGPPTPHAPPTPTKISLPTSAPPQTHPENLSVKEDALKRRWSASDVAEDAPPQKKR